ncbi:MAG: PAS domain S-box protein [Nitrospirae bacterium]|nr:PAS domain S-box protein [Nitrospirota bacterium]MBF0534186.1 PAS domain S-box protein [Nitrospirota bacterium]MBF0615900.1 PAS domain S-box protein [Nitrospirota bacterium]
MSIKSKFVAAILLISAIPLFLMGLIIYNHYKNSLFITIENHLMELGTIQNSRIKVSIERFTDSVRMIENRPLLKKHLALYNETGDINALNHINETIDDIRKTFPMFHEISIVNTAMKVVSSSNASSVGMVYKENEILPKRDNSCGYVEVFKGEDNYADLRFSCLLTIDNKLEGFVTAIVHGGFLNEITNDYSNMGKTGETAVAKRDKNGNALFIVPLRFDSNAAFRRVVSKDDTKVLMTQALLKKDNLFKEAEDYRGVSVFGVTHYLKDTDWGIVVKIFKSEMMEPLAQLRNILIFSYIFLMGIIIITVMYVSKRITAPLMELTNTAVLISKGDFSQKIQNVSKDETGVLATVFNRMTDMLTVREDELSKHRESLEQLVSLRTDELNASNESLESEVEARKITEASLVETNNKLNSLISYIPDIVLFKDVQKRFILVNKVFEEIIGLKRAEVLGKTVEDFFPANDAEVYTNEDETVMRTRNTIRNVKKLHIGDKNIYLDTINAPIFDNSGTLIGLVVIGRDITEMTNITNALQESEGKYRALVENSNDIISRLDKDNRYLYINPTVSTFLDLKQEDFIGKTNCQVGLQEHSPVLLDEKIQEVFNTRHQQEVEIEIKGLRGKTYFSCQLIPEFDSAGEVITVVAISRDITKRVELEHQLMERNEMLEDIVKRRTAKLIEYNDNLIEEVRQRNEVQAQLVREKNLSDTIVNTLPGIFCLFDKIGKLLLWNKNLEAVTEYSSEEIPDVSIFDFFADEQKEAAYCEFRDIFVNRKGDYEKYLCNKSGKHIPFYLVGSVIDLDNEPYLTLIGIDITDRKKIEDELVSSREMLRLNAIYLQNTIEEDRKKIARELHDDLSQALTVLKIEILDVGKSTGLSDKHIIVDKIKNITGIVDNIIDNMHSLVMSLRPTVLDDFGLVSAIEWQINELRQRTNITFEFNTINIKDKWYFDEIGKEYSTILYRVFQESATNVIRHAKAEKVSVKLYNDVESIIMEVEDDGKGINKSMMFDYKSLGIIGMKERVLLVGGTLDISNGASGKGTKITVVIPLKK